MEREQKTTSKCCNAYIDVKESGVSQLSFDVEFTCSKCSKKLDLKPLDVYNNW